MSDSMLAPGRGPRDDRVRSDALRMYREVVGELGGDPEALLRQADIPPEALTRPDAVLSYRAMIQLLEDSAVALDCPDFGLRLAARQGGIAVLGPLAVAMKNSTTIGEAYRYCAAHLQVYSPVVQIQIEEDSASGRHFMRFEILLTRVPQQRQTVENALALTHHAILTLAHGRFGAREVWFAHERLAPYESYRSYFGAPVHFEKPFHAVFFNSRDLAQPIVDQNPKVYEKVSGYIEAQYPPLPMDLPTRVRVVAGRLLPVGTCGHVEVAAELNMHPRTLQRRLHGEGTTFEQIRDDVRRDAASRYLSESTLPLTRVSALLGYSEPSVFTRSCLRWFASSPRRLRERWSQPASKR